MRQKLLAPALALLSATAAAQPKMNGGAEYLLSQTKDVSADFADFANTYFFADSLVDINTATGEGTVEWKRRQLMPRQAFNANTYLHTSRARG